MNCATIAQRLHKAGEIQLQRIRNQGGPRNFDEWLIKAESVTCLVCTLKTARECPLQELVEQNQVYRGWAYCVKCGGRQVAETDAKGKLYGHSTPVMVVGERGNPVVTRCDCEAAGKTWKSEIVLAPEPYLSMCENQRHFWFQSARVRTAKVRQAEENAIA
jgi:hypothetical protein